MIRPSNLPKLSLCAQYEGGNTSSPAAERGTRIDAMFRDLVASPGGRTIQDPEEWAVAEWAAEYVRRRSGVEECLTSEDACRVTAHVNGLEIGGTMDAVCPEMHLLYDLKTGEIRDYRAQMAAYALACMEHYNATEWTAVLVFADKREIREHRFRIYEAQALLSEIVSKRMRDIPEATPCDYCGWCAKAGSCGALHDAGNRALGLLAEPDRFARILENPATLGLFLQQAAVVEDWIEQARARAKQTLLDGGDVVGWKLQKRSGRATVRVEKLIAAGADLERILPSTVSEKTAREALPSLPDSLIERGEDSFALVQDKAKKLKGN